MCYDEKMCRKQVQMKIARELEGETLRGLGTGRNVMH